MTAPNEFRGSLVWLQKHEKPGDALLVAPAYYMSVVQYYYSGRLKIHGMPRDHDLIRNDFGQGDGAGAARAKIREYSGRDRIWYVLPREHNEPRVASGAAAAELRRLGFRVSLTRNFISDVIPRYDGFILLFTKQKRPGRA